MKNQICLSIDCTQSMHPASYVVQREVTNLVKFLFSSVPELEISIICHGDDVDPSIETTTLNFSASEKSVVEFLNKMPRYGPNGTEPEFYQIVQMYALNSLSWDENAKKAFIFIADSTPREDIKTVAWQQIAQSFPKAKIDTFAVQCLERFLADSFFKEWTALSNGSLIKLSQFSDLPTLLKILFIYSENVEKAEEYVSTLDITRSFNSALRSLFGNVDVQTSYQRNDGLIPVSLSRFQKLYVDKRQEIRDFVRQSGAEFRPGRGFYQLVKSEKVQPKKEVILYDKKTGEMFTGEKVREMIGLPYGQSGTIRRTDIPNGFIAFVQSTSYTRMLDGHTDFLYEVL